MLRQIPSTIEQPRYTYQDYIYGASMEPPHNLRPPILEFLDRVQRADEERLYLDPINPITEEEMPPTPREPIIVVGNTCGHRYTVGSIGWGHLMLGTRDNYQLYETPFGTKRLNGTDSAITPPDFRIAQRGEQALLDRASLLRAQADSLQTCYDTGELPLTEAQRQAWDEARAAAAAGDLGAFQAAVGGFIDLQTR